MIVILFGGLHPHALAIERDGHLQNITHTRRMERGRVSLVFYLLQGRIQRRLDRAAHSMMYPRRLTSTGHIKMSYLPKPDSRLLLTLYEP